MEATTAGSSQDRGKHRLTAAVYLLELLGVMTGITAIIGVCINYARRSHVEGTIFASHFDWQIRTFWWAFGVVLAAGALVVAGETVPNPLLGALGAGAMLITLFWFVYRVLKGYMWLTAGEPVRSRRDRG